MSTFTTDSPLTNSISSTQYENALLIQLAIGIPILLELLLEYVEILSLKQSGSNILYLLARFLLILGMISPSLWMINHRTILIFLCSESLRRTFIVGFSLTMLSAKSTLAIVLTRNFGLQAFTTLLFYIFGEIFWLLNHLFVYQYQSLMIISTVCLFAGYLLLINLSLKFYGISLNKCLQLNYFSSSSYIGQILSLNNKIVPNKEIQIIHEQIDESASNIIADTYMNICVTGILIFPFAVVIIALSSGNIYFDIFKASITEVCSYTYLQVILMVFLIVIPHLQIKR